MPTETPNKAIDLFHLIADPDSAEVRRFIVMHNLMDHVNFRNISYDSHAEALKSATGDLKVPCLIPPGVHPLQGKNAILAWLQANL
jgi:hypothetical protein